MNISEQNRLIEFVKRSRGELREQVVFLLQNYPDTRENDGLLIYHWLDMFKGVDSHKGLLKVALENKFCFEAVSRERRRIQAAGFYLPSDPAVIKRRKLEKVIAAYEAANGGTIHGSKDKGTA